MYVCLYVCVAQVHMCSYLATWHYPVGNSQEGQTCGHPQHRPALHPNGLLPQAGQVLVPDRQQLLLTVGMGDELKRQAQTRTLNQGRGYDRAGQRGERKETGRGEK